MKQIGETGTTSAEGRGRLLQGRALIGWMDVESASRALAQHRADVEPSAEIRNRVESAHAAVARRQEGVRVAPDQVVRELPATLTSYVEELKARPGAAPYFAEGWQVGLADLRHVFGFQSQVVIAGADERVAGAVPGDLSSIAQVTVPSQKQLIALTPSLDKTRNIWNVGSESSNLRVIGQFAGNIEGTPPGAVALGFFLSLLPSFMQVALFNDRWLLRDGYHRALGLLRAEIYVVPTFFRSGAGLDQVVPPGSLPLGDLLGPRGPRLTDYLDDSVSAQVEIPAVRRIIAIQALELSVPNSSG